MLRWYALLKLFSSEIALFLLYLQFSISPELVLHCYMTNHHKLRILKHPTVIISQHLWVTTLGVARLGLLQDVTQDWVLIWRLDWRRVQFPLIQGIGSIHFPAAEKFMEAWVFKVSNGGREEVVGEPISWQDGIVYNVT